jgi:hypothetical protein
MKTQRTLIHKRKKVTDMKTTFFFLLALFPPSSVLAQTNPLDFFPHHIGDRWDYQDINTGQIYSMILTYDSIGADGSHNLFYNNFTSYPLYRIDTAYNVFWIPQDTLLNFLRYKLPADSCEAWTLRPSPNFRLWAWVASVESASVFFKPTVVKIFRYDPGNPCSLGSLEEDRLASGFGLIYTWREPWDIRYLRGCIIQGDTFGIITSVVEQIADVIDSSFSLHPNYPNPFNAETNIEFTVPVAEYVSLRVFDILSREVALLYEGRLQAGIHRVRWSTGQIPSGVYLLRMSTQHGTQARKMILMR